MEPDVLLPALFNLNSAANSLDFFLDFLGFLFGHSFFNRLRRGFNQILCFLQTECGNGTDLLDNFDFLLPGRG